jgi:hypothetical protein
MPKCVKCAKVSPSAEVRRRRNHPGEHVCKDATGCGRRVTAAKNEQRATELSPRRRRRIELAFEQLEKLRQELGPAWGADALASVAGARAELEQYLNPKGDDQ